MEFKRSDLLGGLTPDEWNMYVREQMHKRQPVPCVGCYRMDLTTDYKLIMVNYAGKTVTALGGCKKCSDIQTKQLYDFYYCRDIF